MSTKKQFDTYNDLEKRLGKLTFSKFLKAWRECDDLSQAAFARKLNISRQNLCDLEKGRRSVSLNKLIKMAKVLGIPPQYLLELYFNEELKKAKANFKVKLEEN